MADNSNSESFLAQLNEVNPHIVPGQSEPNISLNPILPPEGSSNLVVDCLPSSNLNPTNHYVDPNYKLPPMHTPPPPPMQTCSGPVSYNVSTPSATEQFVANGSHNSPSPSKLQASPRAHHAVQQTVTGNVKVQLMEIGVEEFKSNVEYIQQQFPALPRRQVCDAFSKSNFNCQAAIEALRREQEKRERPPPPPVMLLQATRSPATPRVAASPKPVPAASPSPTPAVVVGTAVQSRPRRTAGPKDEHQQQYKRVVSTDAQAELALRQKLKSNVRSRVFSHGVRLSQSHDSEPSPAAVASPAPTSQSAAEESGIDESDKSDREEPVQPPPKVEKLEAEKPEAEMPQAVKEEAVKEEPEDPSLAAFRLLRESFPLLDDAIVTSCLEECDFDVDTAIQRLSGRPGNGDSSAKFFKSKQLNKAQVKKDYVRAELSSGAWMDKQPSRGVHSVRTLKVFSATPRRKIKREISAVSDEEVSCVGDEDTSYNRERDYDSDDSDYDNKHSVHSDDERAAVLEFFNSAAPSELMHIPSVSKKKADVLVKLRPFEHFDDLLVRLDSHRQFNSSSLVQSCREVLHMRRMVVHLMSKCEVITQKLEARVASLLDSVTLESADAAGGITLQPAALNPDLHLKPYQMVGLNWLRLLHEENLSAILGDQMGLGKTIQIIAFLAQLLEEGDQGPHLVIVPSSTLVNWEREIQKWCPQLQVLTYYGTLEERKAIRQAIYGDKREFRVLLTTYNIATGTLEDRAVMKNLEFEYGIFDEAHMLKNCQSRRYKVLMTFRVKRRILLTGTPLQNNLVELMSLLSFVIPDVFTASRQCTDMLKKMFNMFSRPSTTSSSSEDSQQNRTSYELERIEHAKRLMRPFFLRRTKSQVLTQLPQKAEEVMLVPMTERQRVEYDELVGSLRRRFESNNGEQDVAVNYILQLRKAANHCLLHRRVYDEAKLREMAERLLDDPGHKRANQTYIFEDLAVMNDYEVHKTCQMYPVLHEYALNEDEHLMQSGKLAKLDSLLPELQAEGHRVVIFSQFVMMLDIIEAFLQLRAIRFLRIDGATPVADRQELLDKFAEEKDIPVFLLSTRAGGLGINLTAADTVIIHDIDFNPYNDKQAEDRCHRLGQEKPVRVIRLLAEGSVEEGMHRIAVDKLRLEKEVTTFKPDEEDQEDEDASVEGGSSSRKRKAAESSDGDTPQLKGSELVGLLSECLGVS